MEIIIIIAFLLLVGIFKRTGNRTGGAFFIRRCPHCRQKIASSATACAWCSRDVEPTRWVWNGPPTKEIENETKNIVRFRRYEHWK